MQITLRTVCIDDAKLLHHLLKDRPNYANISHTKMPEWDDHCDFIKSDPYDSWYIIEGLSLGSRIDVGAIYLTRDNEIGVGVLRKYWGKGYGRSAIKEIMQTCQRDRYYANVSPLNMGSQKLFKKMGFEILQYTLKYDK